jgi:glycosyltransferase involved in cell wall biosynthesis
MMSTTPAWDPGQTPSMHWALASLAIVAAQVRVTVDSILSAVPRAAVTVLDADGSYVPVGPERVLAPEDAGITATTLHRELVLLTPDDLECRLASLTLRVVLRQADVAVWIAPGVILLRPPHALVVGAAQYGLAVVSPCTRVDRARALPTDGDTVPRGSVLASGLFAVSKGSADVLDLWDELAANGSAGERWVDLAAACHPHTVRRDSLTLLTAESLGPRQIVSYDPTRRDLLVDGRPVDAVDLTGFDPSTPWLFDARPSMRLPLRLSDHPALGQLCRDHARDLTAAQDVMSGACPPPEHATSATAIAVHPQLRRIVRDATRAWLDGTGTEPPDAIDPDHRDSFLAWLLEPLDDFRPATITRYLASVYTSRPDLQMAFPFVPAHQTGNFVRWAADHGIEESDYLPQLIARSVSIATSPERATADTTSLSEARADADAGTEVRATRRGVNVVGFLHGELGIGESARLMLTALDDAGIEHSTLAVRQILQSRQSSTPTPSAAPLTVRAAFDTTLLCVNADFTPTITRSLPAGYASTYRIGMWYWEVEAFPVSQHIGFRELDEVWVATDFIRDAIAPHSPVPVTTVTPPLPQVTRAPAISRENLGLPAGPLFLFAFDYLSSAGRKNPWGVVDAFRTAFARGEGPVLVLKSINAHRRFGDAERLRLHVGEDPDIVLMEDYLDADERDALMATCDYYVSLHRSEGLGLTIAEAMARAKPVIATAYSGNMQFMDEQNSFPVPWTPTRIGPGNEPYPADGTWADPDVDAAAALMRLVIDEPAEATRRGARAAEDIRTRYSAATAGDRIAVRLDEIRAERARLSRPSWPMPSRVRRVVRRIIGADGSPPDRA